MEHKNMTREERQKAEDSFNNSKIYHIELMTEEPFIQVEDGSKFFIDVIN
jgi:hypothetical protein